MCVLINRTPSLRFANDKPVRLSPRATVVLAVALLIAVMQPQTARAQHGGGGGWHGGGGGGWNGGGWNGGGGAWNGGGWNSGASGGGGAWNGGGWNGGGGGIAGGSWNSGGGNAGGGGNGGGAWNGGGSRNGVIRHSFAFPGTGGFLQQMVEKGTGSPDSGRAQDTVLGGPTRSRNGSSARQ